MRNKRRCENIDDKAFLKALRKAERKRLITRQQLKTMRGQALSGNVEAAEKGLRTIVAAAGGN